jgi:hypothetical protein
MNKDAAMMPTMDPMTPLMLAAIFSSPPVIFCNLQTFISELCSTRAAVLSRRQIRDAETHLALGYSKKHWQPITDFFVSACLF